MVEVYKGKNDEPPMAVKIDLEELKDNLTDLGFPGEELEKLEMAIKAKGYHIHIVWLVKYLGDKGLSQSRCVEFFRGLGMEDTAIAAAMERAIIEEDADVRVRLGGGKREGSITDRLAVFRDEEPPEEGDDEAVRRLHRAVKGGGKED